MKLITLSLLCLSLSSCGINPTLELDTSGLAGLVTSPQPTPDPGVTPSCTPSVVPSEDPVQALVDNENVYREQTGQTALTPGLSCTVQLVSSGQWLSSSSPGYQASQGVLVLTGTAYTYLFQDSFNQPNASSGVNNLIPTALQSLFVNDNYRIVCNGNIVIIDDGYYDFDTNSDDGSIVSINGAQVLNSDGNHAMTDKATVKYYRSGVYTFQLMYAQSGGGSFGMVLSWNGNVIPGNVWYH